MNHSNTNPPPLNIVVVNYNTCEHLRACLQSIDPEQCKEVIVVDNASSDSSPKMVQEHYPWVNLVINKENRGYGRAANQAIARCSSKYVLLLNSDILISPGTLRALSKYMDQYPKTAIVGPRLISADGTSQTSDFPFPTPINILINETSLAILLRSLAKFRHDSFNSHTNRGRPVPWVLGAALMIRNEAFKSIGGFDDSFFMYFEEVDLCYRLQMAGWQIHFARVATLSHAGGASTRQHRAEMIRQLYESLYQFYRRHYSDWRLVQLKFVVSYLMLRNIFRDRMKLSWSTDGFEENCLEEDLLAWRGVLRETWSTID